MKVWLTLILAVFVTGYYASTDNPHGPVHRLELKRGEQVTIQWRPGNKIGSLGLSFCQDKEQSYCFMLDVFGYENGRLGYWWRRHSKNEKGYPGWVAGRKDTLPETVVASTEKPTIDQGTWPDNGAVTHTLLVERKSNGFLEVQLKGGDKTQYKDMSFPLDDDFRFFAVGSFWTVGKVTLEDPSEVDTDEPEHGKVTVLELRGGQHAEIQWNPGNKIGTVGISFCNDKKQTVCFVLDVFGYNAGRLGYWWRKHSVAEKGGLGWVPGRKENLPETVVASTKDPEISQGTWPNDGKDEHVLIVERSPFGKVEFRLKGGDATQNKDLMFDLTDEFYYVSVDSFFTIGTVQVTEPMGKPSEYVTADCGVVQVGQMVRFKLETVLANRPVLYGLCNAENSCDCLVKSGEAVTDPSINKICQEALATFNSGQFYEFVVYHRRENVIDTWLDGDIPHAESFSIKQDKGTLRVISYAGPVTCLPV